MLEGTSTTGTGNNSLDFTHGCSDLLVRIRLHAIQPLPGGASLHGALAVGAARVLDSGSFARSREASDHVCGIGFSRWIWWVLLWYECDDSTSKCDVAERVTLL